MLSFLCQRNVRHIFNSLSRHRASAGIYGRLKGSTAQIVGCYQEEDDIQLTPVGQALNVATNNEIIKQLKISNFTGEVGKARTILGLSDDVPCVAIAGLGKKLEGEHTDDNEDLVVNKENTRVGIAAAVAAVEAFKPTDVNVDPCLDSSAAAEGIFLSSFKFQQFKTNEKKKKPIVSYGLTQSDIACHKEAHEKWTEGRILAESQNFARILMETPSNYKYPSKFTEIVQERFKDLKNVRIIVREKSWLQETKMDCFLSVSQGSAYPPALLEVHYSEGGEEERPIALVGKGVTFDTGGISIKPSQGMTVMKGDMGGGACVLGAIEAAALLKLPINVVGLVGLTENMPSGSATKPGDVFRAMNGKTVEVDNTDAEGRLLLADVLCYANSFKPAAVIDVATLTGAIDVALGAGATGVFCNNKKLWKVLHEAGRISGDRVWRMPLYKYYGSQMDCSVTADLRNTQKKARSAGSCTAAAFLQEFVEVDSWAHFDTAGVMSNEGDVPYLSKGMSGRPTRTLAEALRIIASKRESK